MLVYSRQFIVGGGFPNIMGMLGHHFPDRLIILGVKQYIVVYVSFIISLIFLDTLA